MSWAPAAPHAPATLERLTRDARAMAARARGVLGIEAGDLVAAGWLAYVAAADRGVRHPGCCARARGAMLDAVRQWIGTPWDHDTGERLAVLVPLSDALPAPGPAARATRTRLPRGVRRALAQLTPLERDTLHRMCVLGWDHPTMADTLGITRAASVSRRAWALAKVRALVTSPPRGAPRDTPRRRHSSPNPGGRRGSSRPVGRISH